MSRRPVASVLVLSFGLVTIPLAAQESAPPERIDILVDPPASGPTVEDCSADEEAASISGEIVVCRSLRDQSRYRYSQGDDAANRYAERTALRGAPRSPDFILDCHDQGWPPGCIKMGGPPPPALLIDIKALPQAPPGSDADRIARGLPPLGREVAPSPINPAESAAPEEAR